MQVVSKHGLFAKIVLVGVGIPINVAVPVILLHDQTLAEAWIGFVLICGVQTWLVGLCLISLWRFRIVATETRVESRLVRTRAIGYDQIRRLHFCFSGNLIVYGNGIKIILYNSIANSDEMARLVINKVRGNPVLRVTGDKRYRDECLGPNWRE